MGQARTKIACGDSLCDRTMSCVFIMTFLTLFKKQHGFSDHNDSRIIISVIIDKMCQRSLVERGANFFFLLGNSPPLQDSETSQCIQSEIDERITPSLGNQAKEITNKW